MYDVRGPDWVSVRTANGSTALVPAHRSIVVEATDGRIAIEFSDRRVPLPRGVSRDVVAAALDGNERARELLDPVLGGEGSVEGGGASIKVLASTGAISFAAFIAGVVVGLGFNVVGY